MRSKLLLTTLAAASLFSPGAALADQGLAASQAATNNQNNASSVVLNPSGGTQVNNNVNNAYSSTYSFGPGISCPTPSLAFSAFGGASDAWSAGTGSNGSSLGASVSYIMPLGGETGESCRTLVAEIARQRVLDTQVNMIRVCSELARQQVTVSVSDFPQFEVCRSVTVAGRQAVQLNTGPVFTEQSDAIPVVPVR